MKRRQAIPSAARYTVDAAAKALELLGVFSFREPRLSLADLAKRTGIPRATAFRLLSTLEQSGFLAKEHGAYQLGIKCFVLGNIVAGGLDLRETAHPHLVALRDATRETTQIAILDHWQVVYLERMLSPLPVGFMRARSGAILPAYCTALGKLLLANLPEAEQRDLLTSMKLAKRGPNTITSKKALSEELEHIGDAGFAVNDEELASELYAIAVPVRDAGAEVVAAVGLSAHSSVISLEEMVDALSPHLVSTADRISARLGYRRADEQS